MYCKNCGELLEMDSNVVYKMLTSDTSSTFDMYKMSYKVKRTGDMLYVSLPTMQKIFNVKYNYDAENNCLTINTLPMLYKHYNALVKEAGYYEMSGDFSNQKALIQNMIVVISKQQQVGVISTIDNSTLIGTKYNNMTFSEGMGEFIVQQNNKFGVLTVKPKEEAQVKIGFEYDSLKLIDNNIGLYLAQNFSKYGVLDKVGKVIINLEYDRIGIENPGLFQTDNIRNSYILYNNCIPVKQYDQWFMFNIFGELKCEGLYGFGCVPSTNQTAQNLLLIPASEGVEGIVVYTKDAQNSMRYGVIDVNGIFRIPDSFQSIYKTVSAGKTSYYTLFDNQVVPVSERLQKSSNSSSGSVSAPIQ